MQPWEPNLVSLGLSFPIHEFGAICWSHPWREAARGGLDEGP